MKLWIKIPRLGLNLQSLADGFSASLLLLHSEMTGQNLRFVIELHESFLRPKTYKDFTSYSIHNYERLACVSLPKALPIGVIHCMLNMGSIPSNLLSHRSFCFPCLHYLIGVALTMGSIKCRSAAQIWTSLWWVMRSECLISRTDLLICISL